MNSKNKFHKNKKKYLNHRYDIGFEPPVKNMLIKYTGNLISKQKYSSEFLQLIFSLLSTEVRLKLINDIYPSKYHKKKHADKDNQEYVYDNLDDHESLGSIIFKDMIKKKLYISETEFKRYIGNIWKKQDNILLKNQINYFQNKLSELEELFGLSEDDCEIIIFLFCHSQSKALESFLGSQYLSEYYTTVSIATGIPHFKIQKLLSKKGKLLQSELVENQNCSFNPHYSLNMDIIEYLAGIEEISLAEKYYKRDMGKTYKLESFNVSENSINIIKSLLCAGEPSNILIYGNAGTGKTEFVRSIIKDCGKQAVFVQHGDDGYHNNRRIALKVSANTVSSDKEVIIMDEADNFLNDHEFLFVKKKVEKGWINTFMDGSKAKIIWIANKIDYVEESVLRRFSYNFHFKKFTKKERHNIWSLLIKKHSLKQIFTKEIISKLSAKYQVNAAGIASALKTIETIFLKENAVADKEKILSILHELLLRHKELIEGEEGHSWLAELTDNYDISALNIDANQNNLLQAVKKVAERKNNNSATESLNLNLLFWGKPGTGKTEFAKYLASDIGMDIIIKRASDLLSCWLGMTEKNIRQAFEEAENEKAILFIDEADSFFIARETANRSWEVTQTNELLTQMENHKGILICCTNLMQNLDKASLRRFHWKIEFKTLTSHGKISVYHKYFNMSLLKTALTSAEKGRLMAVPNLSFGDIRAVWQKLRFVSDREINHASIIKEIENEVKYKEEEPIKKTGFVR